MGIVWALLLFSFIVFFHELGHFALAKKNGIDVEEFAIGMGPKIFSKEYKGTKYSIRILPLGGFCAMGEDDSESTAPGSFNSKSVWARISVILAGPVFNFILAFVLAVILVGIAGYDKPEVAAVDEGYPAYEAGIEAGDIIVKMDGKKINLFREITMYNQLHQGEETVVVYLHDGEKKEAVLEPKLDEKLGYYRFGIQGGSYKKANLLTLVQYSVYEVKFMITSTLDSLKMLINGTVGMDQLSGPVGIVDIVDETYDQSKQYGALVVAVQMMNLMLLLTANLGVMNLLPLPALDGGRLIFLFVEAIRGKRVPPEKEGIVHGIGMVLLLGLMAYVLFNDVIRIFFS